MHGIISTSHGCRERIRQGDGLESLLGSSRITHCTKCDWDTFLKPQEEEARVSRVLRGMSITYLVHGEAERHFAFWFRAVDRCNFIPEKLQGCPAVLGIWPGTYSSCRQGAEAAKQHGHVSLAVVSHAGKYLHIYFSAAGRQLAEPAGGRAPFRYSRSRRDYAEAAL